MKEMQEARSSVLGGDDLLEEEAQPHSSILAGISPMDREAWWATDHGFAKSWT